MTNKELIDKYPWLCMRREFDFETDTYYNVEPIDYSYTLLDEMPDGWHKSFGELMAAEIDEELRRYNHVDKYYVAQVKEKFGGLRWYDYGAVGKIHDIVNKYSVISQNVCIVCGKPDVYYTTSGWIFPICRECFENNDYNKIPYDKAVNIDEDPSIPDSYTVECFSVDKETEIITYDISQTVDYIRKKWSDSNQ